MPNDSIALPIHVARRVGVHPAIAAVVWLVMFVINVYRMMPGARGLRLLGHDLQPITPTLFAIETAVFTVLAVVILLPMFPTALDIDDVGIRKTFAGKIYSVCWMDVAGFEIAGSQNPFFKGTLVKVYLNRDVDGIARRTLLLSPRLYARTPDELISAIRAGAARWGRPDQDLAARPPAFGHPSLA